MEKLEINEKLDNWVKSGNAEKELREASEIARKSIEELNISRKIDPKILKIPMGPIDRSGIWDK